MDNIFKTSVLTLQLGHFFVGREPERARAGECIEIFIDFLFEIVYNQSMNRALRGTIMDIFVIKELCSNGDIRWTDHIFKRLLKRNITTAEVMAAIECAQIIEEYPTDYPYPSCLLLGVTANGKYLHIVCGLNTDDQKLWLITAYEPDPLRWENDFKVRKVEL